MDVCKCIVPLRHESTLKSRRAASALVRLMEGGKRWEAFDHLQGVLPQNWGGTEPNSTVICMVKLRLRTNMNLTLCHDEFCGP
ncbi:uncharacterized protein TNCV_107111 [Trichonephila clavipes]|nr:uncharacterized protein TNCV_107111 [Trichonephila clavipes]